MDLQGTTDSQGTTTNEGGEKLRESLQAAKQLQESLQVALSTRQHDPLKTVEVSG